MISIMERQSASTLGLTRYFTGRPCKNGHIAERSTTTKKCLECIPFWNRKKDRLPTKPLSKWGEYKKVSRSNPDFQKNEMDARLKRTYGITLEEYNALHSKQDGRCKICNQPETARNRSLAVDHDHKTGKVRGLLCGKCNMALGKFQDDERILASAIAYLQSSRD